MDKEIKITSPRSKELLAENRDGSLYRRAAEKGLTLSALLEEADPSEPDSPLDAYERCLAHVGVKVASLPERGVFADTLERIAEDRDGRSLVPELLMRFWRQVRFRGTSQRNVLTSNMEGVGGIMRPYTDAATARYKQMAPAIPVNQLVATTTPITGDAYRTFYLTEPTAAELRMVRVGEGAEIPRTKLTGGEHTVRIRKYGRAIEVTYEALRRQRIDKIALYIAKAAVQTEVDKLATLIDVAINGDGNSGTAATSYALTTLDPLAVAGSLNLKGWLAFKAQFENPYQLIAVLCQRPMSLQLQLLSTGNANIPLVMIQGASGFGSLRPINPELADNVGLGTTSAAPANKLLGLDSRLALEQVTEIGADITETERWAMRQVTALVMSEVTGFASFDANAVKILDVAS